MLLPKRSFSDNYFGIGWCKKVLFFLSCCCCLLHDLPTYNVCICNISIRVIHFHARRRSIYHLLVINSKKWQRKLWTCSKRVFCLFVNNVVLFYMVLSSSRSFCYKICIFVSLFIIWITHNKRRHKWSEKNENERNMYMFHHLN